MIPWHYHCDVLQTAMAWLSCVGSDSLRTMGQGDTLCYVDECLLFLTSASLIESVILSGLISDVNQNRTFQDPM